MEDRIQAYLRTAASRARETERIGPFVGGTVKVIDRPVSGDVQSTFR